MIKILHGENIAQSRKRLMEIVREAKNSGWEIVYLDGGKVSLTDIRSALESSSLFGKTKLVVLENLKDPKIFDFLKNGKFDNNLVIWEKEEIKKDVLPRAEKEIFRLPPLIFKFLESLAPGNARESLRMLTELEKEEEPEMIFHMLVRQFRYLILASDLGVSGLAGFPLWQQKKLLTQARLFSPEKLREIYGRLAEMDFSEKTSRDPLPFSSRLDLFIASL